MTEGFLILLAQLSTNIHSARVGTCSVSVAHGARDYVWGREAARLFIDELKKYEELRKLKFEMFHDMGCMKKKALREY